MERGDPNATPEAIFKIVDAENPPLRFFLGSHNLPWVRAAYAERLVMCLLNNSDIFIFAEGHFPGSLDLG